MKNSYKLKEILKEDEKKIAENSRITRILFKKLLEKDPKKRINWDEYFKHPFFENKNKNIINLIYYVKEEKE